MTEKAILFARVSTEQQDLERQKEILIPKIKEDGFADDDIIIIEHKESAIKNDFYNRDGIEELKEKIENENIKAVYATELSRLGRRNDVILKVWGLLEEKIKQLKAEKKKMEKDRDNIKVSKKKVEDNLTTMEDFYELAAKIDNLNAITDDDKIVDIINKVIKSIELEKLDNGWRIRYVYHNLAYNKEMEDEFYDYIKPTRNKIEIYVNGLKQNEKGELVNAYYRLKYYERFKRRINFVGRFKGNKKKTDDE